MKSDQLKYKSIIGKKGFITYSYNDKLLYSLYDPISEADRYIKSLGVLKDTVITVCGAEYINKILLGINKKVISCTPEKFEESIQSKSIVYLNTHEELERYLVDNNIHSSDISVVVWPELLKHNHEFYIPYIQRIKSILYKTGLSLNTGVGFDDLMQRNYTRNMQKIQITGNHPKLLHTDKNNSKNNNINDNIESESVALICSSGGSLELNIEYIRELSAKIPIFALPSAVRFLESAQIFADYIVLADPGYGSLYHLYLLKHRYIVLAHPCINSSLLNLKQDFYFYDYCNGLGNELFRSQPILKSPAEGTVFFNTLRIIGQLGFKSVIISGQDFGFKSGKSHAQGGNFENEFIYRSDYLNTEESWSASSDYRNPTVNINRLNADSNCLIKDTVYSVYEDHFLNTDFNLKLYKTPCQLNPIFDKIPVFKTNKEY